MTIVNEELARAFNRVGKRILSLYLEDLSVARAKELARDSGLLGELVEQAVAEAVEVARAEGRDTTNPASIIPATRYYPTTSTRDCLTVLDQAVRSAPTLHGLTLADCRVALRKALNHKLTEHSIRMMLRRNSEFHTLMVRRGRVQLRSNLIVEELSARHKAKQVRDQLAPSHPTLSTTSEAWDKSSPKPTTSRMIGVTRRRSSR